MKAPQIIMICILVINIGIAAFEHGKPEEGIINNFWSDLISEGFFIGLLIWGGFFK